MEPDETRRARHEEHPGRYQLRVRGHLGPRWAALFDGMTLTPEDDGTTLIDGVVEDQAALHAVLRQIRDLGLELVSVSRGPPL